MDLNRHENVACVTGASGMIGSRIVQKLLREKYKVRILSRNRIISLPYVEFFEGGLEDENILMSFLDGAHLLFHCAAELKNETRMWEVNVLGTERLMKCSHKSGIKYFCHLSSVGVIGKTKCKWVKEETVCNPQNIYEMTKWEAEKLVLRGIEGCKVIVLRPTNVIDEKQQGVLAPVLNRSFLNRLGVFIKGGECAHIIHADDVASAALHFISFNFDSPQCFIVSTDHEPHNTYSELWNLYSITKKNSQQENIGLAVRLPLIVPHLVRLLRRGKSVRGDTRYSSEKLVSTGFVFQLGIRGAMQKLSSAKLSKDESS